ncbi:MAG TPA: glycoside hydrolase family 88 protein, partial [Chitinophagaceae bacterium]|nr:glycoside hydrolase family 88 protein [Chitinophagaceae bacterium]
MKFTFFNKSIFYPVSFLSVCLSLSLKAQKPVEARTDVNTPLHALKVDYPVPYVAPTKENVKAVVDKIFNYLDATTPAQMMNKQTGEMINEITRLDTNTIIKQGDFRLTSYEWGVTYSAMLRAFETTGEKKYNDYVKTRFDFLAKWVPAVKSKFPIDYIRKQRFLNQPVDPHALDDA